MSSKSFSTAEARWSGVGPYYAMFPSEFATRVVGKYTEPGDTIIDPFAGRGTSIYSAAVSGRHGIGVEINPVGWVYATVKLRPAKRWCVEARAHEVGSTARRFVRQARAMPAFFQHCYTTDVLAFLLAARSHLDWRRSIVDRTVMALLLIDLHGKRKDAFSNQMRQTKCMSPTYAVAWWKMHGFEPPIRDPVEFLLEKIKWRYRLGLPATTESRVYLGDSTHSLFGLRSAVERYAPKGARLLFTSPPYMGITNYHYDQWLRFWLLGGPPRPLSLRSRHRGKFEHSAHYRAMLQSAFSNAKKLLAGDATVYVRTDRRDATYRVTRDVLAEIFSGHRITRRTRPLRGPTQTRLFGNGAPREGEVDLILQPA
jgi:hypothetical protein